MDDHTMDKMWQMMQSNGTKTMNLDKDFEEMVSKAKQTGFEWIDQKPHGSGQKKRNKIRDQVCLRSNPQMERIMNFCGQMVLPWGDEGAARCLCADVCLGEGVAVQRHSA